MRVAMPDLAALGLYAALVLVVALYGLTAAAHFPAEHRRPSLQGGLGSLVLWGSMAAAAVAGLLSLRLALLALPGYAAVIAGGLAILAAPLVLNWFPDRFLDGRLGLLAFAGLALLLAGAALGLPLA